MMVPMSGSILNFSAGILQGVVNKVALAYETANYALAGHGVVTSSGQVPVPEANELLIGNNYGSAFYCGHVCRLTYWNVRKTDVELQALTT